MVVVSITSKSGFQKAINNGIILIDFNAPWCAPCRLQEPILEKIAKRFGNRIVVATLNIDKRPDIAKDLDIQSIPTLIVFRNNKEVQRFVGLQPEAALAEALEKLRT